MVKPWCGWCLVYFWFISCLFFCLEKMPSKTMDGLISVCFEPPTFAGRLRRDMESRVRTMGWPWGCHASCCQKITKTRVNIGLNEREKKKKTAGGGLRRARSFISRFCQGQLITGKGGKGEEAYDLIIYLGSGDQVNLNAAKYLAKLVILKMCFSLAYHPKKTP